MRRAQILSVDALLSLILIIMIIGIILNTGDIIKADILNLIEWYDRANIANNMLDVLTKSPGYPENWEDNIEGLKVLGVRSPEYLNALDYDKLLTLNSSKDSPRIKNSLFNLSYWKDFQLEFYLLKKDINISGSFPTDIYITLGDGENQVNIFIAGDQVGNEAFSATNVTLNGEPLLERPQPYDLEVGSVLAFKTLQDIWVYAKKGTIEEKYQIDAYSYIEVYVTGRTSNLQVTYDNGELHVSGKGQVAIIASGYTKGTLTLSQNFTYPIDLTNATFSIVMINGTLVENSAIIEASKDRSPWIEYQERSFVVAKLIYNQTAHINQSSTKELMAGKLKQNVPSYSYLKIDVPNDESGNVTFVILDGSLVKGLLVYKSNASSNVVGILHWKTGNQNITKVYRGNTTTVRIPWSDIFGQFDSENGAKIVEIWLYETSFSSVTLTDLNNIGLLLEPKFEPIKVKLWVWDDR